MDLTTKVLILFALFQAKHLAADFFLQTPKMLEGRDIYLHVGRAQHAGMHMLLSIPVLAVMGTSWTMLLALVVAEFIVHFHIDFWKGSYNTKHELDPYMAKFWHAMGFDQALHQWSYVVMIWVWTSQF